MKNTFIIAGFLVLSLSSVERAHATAVAAATIFEQFAQLVEEVPTAISTAATMASEHAMEYDALVGKPLATMLINVAQQQAANDILTWVNGGLDGTEPQLIVNNPKKYLKDASQSALRGALDDIPADSVYGQSIFDSFYSQYKNRDKTLEQKIKDISKSEMPAYFQSKFCDDDQLTRTALEAVKDSDGNYLEEDLKAKKQELSAYACEGDPNDEAEAQKLIDLQEQPQGQEIAGLDGILFQTLGQESKWDRSQKFAAVAEEEAAKDAAIKENELYNGAGPVSQVTCSKTAADAKEGEEKKCLEETTLTPGESVSSALERAANSGIDRLTNLQNGGLTSLLTNLALAKLTKGLNKAFTEKNETIETIGGMKQDLTSDSETKTSILGPMLKQTEQYLESLGRIEAIDRDYLTAILAYESRITEGRSCYDSLVQTDPNKSSDPQVTAAYDFYNARQTKIDTVKGVLIPELRSIKDARTYVNTTVSQIKNSNSTQEISTIFNKYILALDSGKYPKIMTEATRKTDFMKDQNDIKAEDSKDGSHQTDNFLKTCQSLGGQSGGSDTSGGGI